jgi:predicted DNA-binding protein
MKRINYHVTEDQFSRLKDASERTGLSVAELIRRAIDSYLGSAIEPRKQGKRRSKDTL